jgi:hypothetical protein
VEHKVPYGLSVEQQDRWVHMVNSSSKKSQSETPFIESIGREVVKSLPSSSVAELKMQRRLAFFSGAKKSDALSLKTVDVAGEEFEAEGFIRDEIDDDNDEERVLNWMNECEPVIMNMDLLDDVIKINGALPSPPPLSP